MSDNHTKIHINGEQMTPIVTVIITLLVTIFLLMWLVISLSVVKDDLRRSNTEIRLLQMQVQDQTAVMIRQGMVHPNDLTTGPTSQDKVKK